MQRTYMQKVRDV